MDDAAYGEGAAAAIILRGVQAVGIPPGVQAEGDEVARNFLEAAVGLLFQGDFNFRVGELADLGAFIGGFAEDFGREGLVFGRVVILVCGEFRIFAGLGAGEAVVVALHVGVVGVGEVLVLLRFVDPVSAGMAVEPAREFVFFVVECHGEALPAGIDFFGWGIGGDCRGNARGIGLVQCVEVLERGGSVFRNMSARGASLVEPGEEGILALAAFDFFDPGCRAVFEIGAFVPDAGEGVAPAFPHRPDDDGNGFPLAFDVDGRVVEALAGDEKIGAETWIGLLADLDGLPEGAAAEEGEIGITCRRALPPEFLHIVPRIEGEVIGASGGDMGGKTFFPTRFAFYEIPERHAARRFRDGGDAFGGGLGGEWQRGKEEEDGTHFR